MILAFHSIFSTYGVWLPNEPRGSWSTFVANWELYRYGPATTVREYVAKRPYSRALKREMQSTLKHPVVRLTPAQIQTAGGVLGNLPYTFHALAVMPDHVHAVIGRTDRNIRRAVGHIKSEMTRALRATGSFIDQPIWGEHGWNVYLDTPADVARCIDYVNQNPLRDNLPAQHWPSIHPFPSKSGTSPAAK